MGRFVEDIEQNMSAVEYKEHQLFYNIEPWGELRADIRSAHEMQQIGNINRNPKTRRSPWKLTDFLMELGEMKGDIEKEEDPELRQQKLDDDISRVFGGFVKPKEKEE